MPRHLRIIAVFALAGIAASLAAAWLQYRASQRSIAVKVALATLGPVTTVAHALQPVPIRSCQTRLVSAPESSTAVVSAVHVAEGQIVSAGELLIQLSDSKLMVAVVDTQQAFKAMRMAAAAACGSTSGSERQPRRLEPLIRKRVQEAGQRRGGAGQTGAANPNACLTARSAQRLAMQRYRQAADAAAALTIRAPMSGLITGLTTSAGAGVGAEPLLRLADLSCLQLRASLPIAVQTYLRTGMPVCIGTSDASLLPDCTARLTAVLPRSAAEEVTIDVALSGVPPATYGDQRFDVSVPLGGSDDVVRIENDAVIYEGDARHVWKLDSDAVSVHRQPIKTGIDDGRHVEVIAGLRPGDRVAIAPRDTVIKDGSAVRIAGKTAAQ